MWCEGRRGVVGGEKALEKAESADRGVEQEVVEASETCKRVAGDVSLEGPLSEETGIERSDITRWVRVEVERRWN